MPPPSINSHVNGCNGRQIIDGQRMQGKQSACSRSLSSTMRTHACAGAQAEDAPACPSRRSDIPRHCRRIFRDRDCLRRRRPGCAACRCWRSNDHAIVVKKWPGYRWCPGWSPREDDRGQKFATNTSCTRSSECRHHLISSITTLRSRSSSSSAKDGEVTNRRAGQSPRQMLSRYLVVAATSRW